MFLIQIPHTIKELINKKDKLPVMNEKRKVATKPQKQMISFFSIENEHLKINHLSV